MIWFLSLALAAGQHTGIPTTGIPGLGEPSFLTPRTGWTAPVEGGLVRVFVGPTEADAKDWYQRSREGLTIEPVPAGGIGDEAFGDGAGLLAWRDGNVAVMVRCSSGARQWALLLHDAMVDGIPWPDPVRLLHRADGTWVVPGAPRSVQFRGGKAVAFRPGEFRRPPEEVVVWDEWGRPSVVERP